MNTRLYLASSISLVLAIMASSCDKPEDEKVKVNLIGAGVEINVMEPDEFSSTKSYSPAVLLNEYGDDNFGVKEYEGDWNSLSANTRGTEIKTMNIVANYGRFQAKAYLKAPLAAGEDPADQKYFDLQSVYDGSKWNWCENGSSVFLLEKEHPRWLTDTPMTVWSYAPVGSDAGCLSGNIEPAAIDSISRSFLDFNYTVQSLTSDQKDILFAYNLETREFQKNAEGKYDADENGVITAPFVAGQNKYYDVHFKHALAAVKFELGDDMDGVDIKSIKINNLSDSGHCKVTGSGSGTGDVDFDWTNLSPAREWTINFGSGQSVAAGYASTGNGVMFMIPQQQSDVTLTVEFTKYGSETFIRRHVVIPSVDWKAGKCYIYKLSGTIHVPGEILFGTQTLTVSKFKGGNNKNVFTNSIPLSGGIKKVGIVATDYSLKDNGASTVVITPARDGSLSTLSASALPAQTSFQYNFQDVDPLVESSTTVDEQHVYTFGLGGSSTETYYSNYYIIYDRGTETTEKYMVFDTEGWTSFNITAVTNSSNNGNAFSLYIKAIMILEVETE